MITKRAFIDPEVGLLRQFARRHLSRDMCDAVHKLFPPDFRMITKKGSRIVKAASRIEDAMGFITDRIRRPGPPQTLYIPPTRKKKVDENGNILKPLVGQKNKGEFFGKRNGTFLGSYADDIVRAINRNFSDSSTGD